MANGTMTAKLLLNSKDFDKNIKKSKQQVSDFERAGQQMGSKLVGAFGQLAGAMLAIKGAGDAFKAVINSSQAIGDAYASTMATAKTVTDNFIYSLANADFSTFNSGLDDMISKAREAYAAMDQLGNTKMAVSYQQTTLGADYSTYITNARDKELSIEERQAWLDKADKAIEGLKEGQQTLRRDAVEAIKKKLAAESGVDKSFITEDAVQRALLLDTRLTNIEEREKLMSDYQALMDKVKAIDKQSAADAQSAQGAGGGWKEIFQNLGKSKSSIETTPVDVQKYYDWAKEEKQKLYEENAELLVAYTLLGRDADAVLQEAYDIMASASVAQSQVASMERTHNKVADSLKKEAEAARDAAQAMQEYQQMLSAVNYGSVSTGIAPGTSPMGAAPAPLADLPKGIAMLDESSLPAISFGSDEQTDTFMTNIDTMTSGVDTLNSAFSALGGVIGEDNAKTMSFIETTLNATQAIIQFAAQTAAEIAIRKKNKAEAVGEAAAKTMSAHASIPFAGIAAGIAAVSAIIATIQSIPKFADGGIVTSATLGVFGEAGPEAVMPLDKLNDFVSDREVRVTGKIVGQGKDLNVIIDNYNRVRAVK